MPRIVTAVLAVGLVVAPASAGDIPFVGTWTGTVEEEGVDPYPAIVRIEPSGRGSFVYPTYECGGTLSRVGSSGTEYLFQETYVFGQDECVRGSITLTPEGDRLNWLWREDGGENRTARAVLERKPAP